MRLVTVVCTGNLCRSPMAEVFLAAHLRALGVDDVTVESAGTHALTGGPAMPEAVAAVRPMQLDLSAHRTRAVDQQTIDRSELILCATEAHREFILTRWRGAELSRVRLFNEFIGRGKEVDVDDPMGLGQSTFDLAARVIEQAMQAWARRLQDSRPLT